MNDKIDKLESAYEQTVRQLGIVNLEVIKLTERKRFLEELGAGASQVVKRPAKPKGTAKKRAPKGSVDQALLGVLNGQGQTNAEIRTALKAKGYQFSLEPMPLAKAMNRMAKAGKVAKAKNGKRVEFSTLPPP